MNKQAIAAFTAATIGLVQVSADAADFIDFVGVLTDSYQHLTSQLTAEIDEHYDGPVADIVQSTTRNALGVLGFPDPAQLSHDISQQFDTLPQSDITQPVPVTQSAMVIRQLNRDLLREQSATVLSLDGQQQLMNETHHVTDTVWQTQVHADTAQAAISTQQAIKEMAQLQARQAELLGSMQTALLQSRQDTAVQSLALADISENLDRQLTSEQLLRRAEVQATLQQAAQARLF